MAINFIIPIFKKIAVKRHVHGAITRRIDSIVCSVVASSFRKNPVMKYISILHSLLYCSIICLVQGIIPEVRDMRIGKSLYSILQYEHMHCNKQRVSIIPFNQHLLFLSSSLSQIMIDKSQVLDSYQLVKVILY